MYIPARPPRIEPVELSIKVLTPTITQSMNDQISEGKMPPYVYFGFTENDYLTMSQWIQSVLLYIRQQNAILDYHESIIKERSEVKESKE